MKYIIHEYCHKLLIFFLKLSVAKIVIPCDTDSAGKYNLTLPVTTILFRSVSNPDVGRERPPQQISRCTCICVNFLLIWKILTSAFRMQKQCRSTKIMNLRANLGQIIAALKDWIEKFEISFINRVKLALGISGIMEGGTGP